MNIPGFTAVAVFEAAARSYAMRIRRADVGHQVRPQLQIRQGMGTCPVPTCSSGDGLEECCCTGAKPLCVISQKYCYCISEADVPARSGGLQFRGGIPNRV